MFEQLCKRDSDYADAYGCCWVNVYRMGRGTVRGDWYMHVYNHRGYYGRC